jgi:hypothetical protein
LDLYEIFYAFFRDANAKCEDFRELRLTKAVRSKLHVHNRFNYWKTFSHK